MHGEVTKVQRTILGRIVGPRPPLVTALYLLAFTALALATSCSQKLNQHNGRYYSARDMARLKRGERAPSRPATRPALTKTKVKTTAPS
ncbi:MAG: hypothetical protein EOO36_06905, partial [Cytophagaceae bacterium]